MKYAMCLGVSTEDGCVLTNAPVPESVSRIREARRPPDEPIASFPESPGKVSLASRTSQTYKFLVLLLIEAAEVFSLSLLPVRRRRDAIRATVTSRGREEMLRAHKATCSQGRHLH